MKHLLEMVFGTSINIIFLYYIYYNIMKSMLYILLLLIVILIISIISTGSKKSNLYRIINVVKHDPINTKSNIDKNIINIKEDVVRSMVKFNTHIVDKNNNKINPNNIKAPSTLKITNRDNKYIMERIN